MCEQPSGANVTEQFFIELQYCLDMYNLKLFCIVFVLLHLHVFLCLFLSEFFLFKNMVQFMFCNAKTI